MPRALTLQDRNRAAKTWGCCDRDFWNYRTLRDAPSATFQQLMLPQAIAFNALPGTPYAGQAILLQGAVGALRYWASVQHATGAFDEWYRNEHSYCATAFTTYGAAQTALLLQSDLDAEARADAERALTRASEWLSTRFNDSVMNQNLAACCALLCSSVFLNKDWVRHAFEKRWERTVATQHDEGWFPEYGGADPGYSTLALDLMAILHRNGAELGAAPAKLAQFLAHFVCGGNGLGEPLGSRGTAHALPFGAEYFAALGDPNARALATLLRDRYRNGCGIDPSTVDDRYFAYFYLPQFALAATIDAGDGGASTASGVDTVLPAAGFRFWHVGDSTVVASIRRHGAFVVHRVGQDSEAQLGFWAETRSGERWSSCSWSETAAEQQLGHEQRHVVIRGDFSRVEDSLPLVKWGLVFGGLTRGPLRFPKLAERFQKRLKRRKIEERRERPLSFERSLRIDGGQLEVRDRIERKPGCPALAAIYPVADIDVHSPSARLATSGYVSAAVDPERAREHARVLNEHGQVEIVTWVPLH
ncbi:MAG: hypothetical protein AAF581_07625 [Planctomycetota bacterium]